MGARWRPGWVIGSMGKRCARLRCSARWHSTATTKLSAATLQRLARLAERTTSTDSSEGGVSSIVSDAWKDKSVLKYARSLEALSKGSAAEETSALQPEAANAVYNSAVEFLGSYGDVAVLESLVRAMDRDSISPSAVLMANVVAALCSAEELSVGVETYHGIKSKLSERERQRCVLLLMDALLQAGGRRRSSDAFRSFATSVVRDPSAGLGLRCNVAALARDGDAYREVWQEVCQCQPSLSELQLCLEAAVEMSDQSGSQQALEMIVQVAHSDSQALNEAHYLAIKAARGDFASAKRHFDGLQGILQRNGTGDKPSADVCKALIESFCMWSLSTPHLTIRLFDDLAKLAGPSEALIESIAQYWQERDFDESHAELIYATLLRAKEAGVQVRAERLIPARNRTLGMPPFLMGGVTLRIPEISALLGKKEGFEASRLERDGLSASADAKRWECRLLLLCAEELSYGKQRNRSMLQRLVAEIDNTGLRLDKEEWRLLGRILVQVGSWRAYDDLLKEMEAHGMPPGVVEFCEGIKAFQAADVLLDGSLRLNASSVSVLTSAMKSSEWITSRELFEAGPERFDEQVLDIVQALLRRPGVCYNTAVADVDHVLDTAARLQLKLSNDAQQEVERLLGEAWARENEWTPALEEEDAVQKESASLKLSQRLGAGLRWQSLLKEPI